MQTFLAVLTDLLHFLYERFVGTVPDVRSDTAMLQLPVHPSALALNPATLSVPHGAAASPVSSYESVVVTQYPIGLVVRETTHLYAEPTVAFDNALGTLPCGTPVTEGERTGRFVAVALTSGTRGFVLADMLAPRTSVLPQLTRGHRYLAAEPETVAIRQFLSDCFRGQVAHLPLTPEEYVTYKLQLSGYALPWPVTHGRIAGTWARKLRGVPGVHIDVQPRTGSVMEYIIDDIGYLAFVTKVSPDLTITIEGIGLTFEAQFTEQVFTERDWRELRPLFITLR